MSLKQRKKLSLQAIHSKKFNFTLDGVPESQDPNVSLKTTLIDIVNEGQKTKLVDDDLGQVYRQGAPDPNSTKPRPISLVMKNEGAHNALLRARGKLAKKSIWINEDLPASYRRRKTMLRDLVKKVKQKKHQAKIDHGGISIDGKKYGPEQLSRLPQGIRPHDVSTIDRLSIMGLPPHLYGPPLSNMAPAYFLHDGTLFSVMP